MSNREARSFPAPASLGKIHMSRLSSMERKGQVPPQEYRKHALYAQNQRSMHTGRRTSMVRKGVEGRQKEERNRVAEGE